MGRFNIKKIYGAAACPLILSAARYSLLRVFAGRREKVAHAAGRRGEMLVDIFQFLKSPPIYLSFNMLPGSFNQKLTVKAIRTPTRMLSVSERSTEVMAKIQVAITAAEIKTAAMIENTLTVLNDAKTSIMENKIIPTTTTAASMIKIMSIFSSSHFYNVYVIYSYIIYKKKIQLCRCFK
jgi:hypothetical protein